MHSLTRAGERVKEDANMDEHKKPQIVHSKNDLLTKIVDLCIQCFDLCATMCWTCQHRWLLLRLRLLSDAVLIQLLA